MRIYSKFHDYYDIGLAYGVDDIVYVRKTDEIKDFKVPDIQKVVGEKRGWRGAYTIYNNWWRNSVMRTSELFFVGFCGKLYPAYEIGWGEYNYDAYSKTEIVYSIEALDKLLDKYPAVKKAIAGDGSKSKRYGYNSTYESIVKLFNEFHHGNINDVFFELKTPSFYWKAKDANKLVINPVLKDLKFQRMVDPYTAYQEISMFIGGVLGMGEPETIDISDLDLIEQKGFDKKWSFRKLPEKMRS